MNELIHGHITDDHVCVLTFDRPDSSANIFDRATLAQLEEHLNFVEGNSQLKGLVITSAKKTIFIAGADLHSFSRSAQAEEVRALVEMGQSVFNRIAKLPIPVVAAIHGACVGGGYEICLACHYRLASPDKVTKIGLPETQLGLLPAWGGSTRLPRLVGLPKALNVILAGKTLAAKQALKYGLVDDLVPREYLVDVACQRIKTAGQKLRHQGLKLITVATNRTLVAKFLNLRLQADLLKKTRGHYPAVLKALEVVTRGATTSISDSLKRESEALVQLVQTETCKNLIRLFFLQERARKLSGVTAATASPLAGSSQADQRAQSQPEAVAPVKQLAVIGAGVMGAGIAQWASARELKVILRDLNPELVAKGLASIAKLYEQGVQRHTFSKLEARSGLDRIFPAAAEAPLRNADLIIEAAVEKLEVKQQLFRRLDELAGPRTILATNTSALSISEIAAVTRHPERVVGIHFFNPVHRMQLVEVIFGQSTDPQVVRRAVKFVQHIGKLPVVVKDSPGFLVNRILMPYLIEAGHLFESGARVEDVDEAMLEFGMPMGPLRLIDEVGVDVSQHVADTLAAKFSTRLSAPDLLGKMLQAGLLGRKNGRGFYLHARNNKEPDVNPQIDQFHIDARAANLSREQLRTRMVMLMVNEAARCLEEGIVAEAADADFGMIMGTGFAPFRGGPLRYADHLGAAQVVAEMNGLASAGAPRFAACARLQAMAATGKKFYEEKGDHA
jgi:3-hydroxyacyl-CoA dehydrogenase/enoyl-CoA hydratase/3-hydroxybutyryl-CoA epimerase